MFKQLSDWMEWYSTGSLFVDTKVSVQSNERYNKPINFMVTPCINNTQHFNIQLIHTTLKNVELLEHFKISKIAPTCFGLQGNHHLGATIST